MILSIVLPLTSAEDTTLPHHLGRANYAALLAEISKLDAALAQQIHDSDGPKPITCSGLLDATTDREGTHIKAGQRTFLRITTLTDATSQAIRTLFNITLPHPQSPIPNRQSPIPNPPSPNLPTTWTLLDHPFEIGQPVCDPAADPWTGHTTYESLAAQQLTQGDRPNRKVSVTFGSPTSFKSKGMHLPVPLPSLFFGSLVERWNHFSPVTLSPEMRRFGEEMVALSNYKLQTRPVIQKSGAPLIGAVGRATFTALGGDRYWLSVMQMLADFALYSGVGVKTTTGMGQVRRTR